MVAGRRQLGFLAAAALQDTRLERVDVAFQVDDQVRLRLVAHRQVEQVQVAAVVLVGDVLVVVGVLGEDLVLVDAAVLHHRAAFAQFASDLDKATQAQLARGLRTLEVLKQGEYVPMPVEKQVTVIWAVTNGLCDGVPVEQMRAWEAGLHEYVADKAPDVLQEIRTTGKLDDETVSALKHAVEQYNASGSWA